MKPKLLACKYVPLGFEMAIVKKEVKAWDLWWNVKMTEDPESWDSEIKWINKMQGRLGEPSVDQRLIRAQMAEFRRFIEEHILVYAIAINSWLKEAPLKHVTFPISTRYTSKDSVLELLNGFTLLSVKRTKPKNG